MKVALFTLLACSAVPLLSAQAQMTGGDSYVAETKAQPGCRPVVLHVTRSGGDLAGVVFFKDGSGVSSVKGYTDGKTVNWTMASINGSGPAGDVTGTISPQGALQAHMVSKNCTLEMMVPQYRDMSNGG